MKLKIRIHLISLLFLSTLLNLTGQTNHFEFSISPTLSYRTLVEDYFNHQVGLRYDIALDYYSTISNTVVFGTGLGFSRMGYNARLNAYDQNGIAYTVKLYTARDFIELPMYMGYWVKRSNQKPILLNLSFVNQVFVHQIAKIKDSEFNNNNDSEESFSEIRNSNLKIYNIAVKLGATYEQNLENNLSLRINPFFKYGLLNMNNVHDFALGLKIGLGYQL